MFTRILCSFGSIHSFFAKVGLLFISYFTPIAEMVHVMLIFLLLDTISGIWASLKEGNKLQSNKLRKTVYKFLWYTIAVMLSWMMEKTFSIMDWTNLASLVAGFICFVELKSVFENITRLTGDPIFTRIIKIFKRKGQETIGDLADDEPNGEPHECRDSASKL